MTKHKPVRLHWVHVPLEMSRIFRGELMLTLTIARTDPDADRYGLLALEQPAAADTPEAVFAAHSHHSLGVFEGRAAVLAAAQNYAQRWKQGEVPNPEPCNCGEIETVSVQAEVSGATDGSFRIDIETEAT